MFGMFFETLLDHFWTHFGRPWGSFFDLGGSKIDAVHALYMHLHAFTCIYMHRTILEPKFDRIHAHEFGHPTILDSEMLHFGANL